MVANTWSNHAADSLIWEHKHPELEHACCSILFPQLYFNLWSFGSSAPPINHSKRTHLLEDEQTSGILAAAASAACCFACSVHERSPCISAACWRQLGRNLRGLYCCLRHLSGQLRVKCQRCPPRCVSQHWRVGHLPCFRDLLHPQLGLERRPRGCVRRFQRCPVLQRLVVGPDSCDSGGPAGSCGSVN